MPQRSHQLGIDTVPRQGGFDVEHAHPMLDAREHLVAVRNTGFAEPASLPTGPPVSVDPAHQVISGIRSG